MSAKSSIRLKLLLSALFLTTVCASPAFAQWHFHGSVGGDINFMLSNMKTVQDYNIRPGGGFMASIGFEGEFNKHWSFCPEINYIQKNYSIERGGAYSAYCTKYVNSYLDFPLNFRLSFGLGHFKNRTSLQGFVNLGPYLGCWLASVRKGVDQTLASDLSVTSIPYHDFSAIDKDNDHRFDVGACLGLGLKYNVSKLAGVTFEVRDYLSFLSMHKKYDEGLYDRHNTLSIIIGACINL